MSHKWNNVLVIKFQQRGGVEALPVFLFLGVRRQELVRSISLY
jgi:hypothetical protein